MATEFCIAIPPQIPAPASGNDLVAKLLSQEAYSLGSGNVKLTPIANMIRLPSGHEEFVIDYHGVARDSRGRIYVLYNSLQRFDHTRALARFHYVYDESTDRGACVFDAFLGTRDWAEGTPHGLNLSKVFRTDSTSHEEVLLIVNNDGAIQLTDLDGLVRWRKSFGEQGPQKPTSAAAAQNSDTIGIVDGYGTNINFLCTRADGELAGRSGAKGGDDGQSITNHGVDLDPDGQFVVADRGNTRLTWWHSNTFEPILIKGRQRKLDMPGLQVCSVSFLGDYAVVPCLNSKLAFLVRDANCDAGYKVDAVIDIPPNLVAAGIDGIHDAEFTPDGRYVLVAVWERRRAERQIPTLTAFRFERVAC